MKKGKSYYSVDHYFKLRKREKLFENLVERLKIKIQTLENWTQCPEEAKKWNAGYLQALKDIVEVIRRDEELEKEGIVERII